MSDVRFDQFAYINGAYGLAAKKGVRVAYTGGGVRELGTITGADGGHLLIRLDGHKNSFPYHPTWELSLLEPTPWNG